MTGKTDASISADNPTGENKEILESPKDAKTAGGSDPLVTAWLAARDNPGSFNDLSPSEKLSFLEKEFRRSEPASKLTKGKIERISSLIRKGVPVATACATAGINKGTLRRWIEKGKDNPESIYACVTAIFEEAMAVAESSLVESIHDIGDRTDDWKAHAHILAKRFPANWADRQQVDVNHSVNMSGVHDEIAALLGKKTPELAAADVDIVVTESKPKS